MTVWGTSQNDYENKLAYILKPRSHRTRGVASRREALTRFDARRHSRYERGWLYKNTKQRHHDIISYTVWWQTEVQECE